MKKGNFILLIILCVIIALVALTFALSRKPTDTTNNTAPSGGFFDFLPFGKNTGNNKGNNSNGNNNTDNDNIENEAIKILSLTKISSMPISGYGVFSQEIFSEVENSTKLNTEAGYIPPSAPPTEKTTILRYLDKINGNIYQTFIKDLQERKLSQTVIPGIHEAFFGDNGQSIVMRYLRQGSNVINTFVGNLPKYELGADSVGNTELLGSFLPENIIDMVVSPDSSKIFYLSKLNNGVVGVIYTPLTKEKIQVFDSPFTEWLTTWPNENTITLTTKASGEVPGYMYVVDPINKNYRKIIGDIKGLTTLMSPDGRLVLYSNGSMSLAIYDKDTKISRNLKLKTLPEKCVWGKDGSYLFCAVPQYVGNRLYPDVWYQGEISFLDNIWRVDIGNLTETMILNQTKEVNNPQIDAVKLSLDDNDQNLFFMDKKESYLWGIKLK